MQCTYWNQNLDGKFIIIIKTVNNFHLDGYGGWSNEGCNSTTSNNEVFCECNHLTNFAMLLVTYMEYSFVNFMTY